MDEGACDRGRGREPPARNRGCGRGGTHLWGGVRCETSRTVHDHFYRWVPKSPDSLSGLRLPGCYRFVECSASRTYTTVVPVLASPTLTELRYHGWRTSLSPTQGTDCKVPLRCEALCLVMNISERGVNCDTRQCCRHVEQVMVFSWRRA